MTVKELKELLSSAPDNAEICYEVYNEDSGRSTQRPLSHMILNQVFTKKGLDRPTIIIS